MWGVGSEARGGGERRSVGCAGLCRMPGGRWLCGAVLCGAARCGAKRSGAERIGALRTWDLHHRSGCPGHQSFLPLNLSRPLLISFKVRLPLAMLNSIIV